MRNAGAQELAAAAIDFEEFAGAAINLLADEARKRTVRGARTHSRRITSEANCFGAKREERETVWLSV